MINVLLVDGDFNNQYTIKQKLERLKEDYIVETAENGKEGLIKWRETNPDIIITDIRMPQMDGLKMIKIIRASNKEIPIIVLTNRGNGETAEESYNHGADYFIRKPLDIKDLDDHIKKFIKTDGFWVNKTKKNYYEIGRYTLDTRRSVIYDNIEKKYTHISEVENEIIAMLAEANQEVVTTSCINHHLGKSLNISPNALYTHISNIRKLFKDDPRIEIKALTNVGYRLIIAD